MGFLTQIAFSQDKSIRYKTSAIVSIGTNMYSGDLCKGCSNIGYGASLSSRFKMTKKILFRPEFDFQHLQSQVDETSQLAFENNMLGAILNFEFGLHRLDRGRTSRSKKELFLVLAPLVYHHNPYTILGNQKTYLAPLQTEKESYSKLIPGVKVGMNFMSAINKKSRLGVQLDYTLLLSDYVDDVSANYVDYALLDPNRGAAIDPTGKAEIGSARGNNSNFDGFLRIMLSWEISFEKIKSEF